MTISRRQRSVDFSYYMMEREVARNAPIAKSSAGYEDLLLCTSKES